MWFKFKNVATLIIETFHLLLITILLGNPFNVKQIDDIVVMASTAKTTLATIMANSATTAADKQQPSTPSILTAASSSLSAATSLAATTAVTSPSLSASSLFFSEESVDNGAATNNNLYDSTFAQAIDRNDSNEIDILNDDSDNYESGLLRNYIMTKHIALSSNLTQLPATVTTLITTEAATRTTTKLLIPTIKPAKATTTKITSTTRKLLSLSTLTSSAPSSSSSSSSLLSSTLPILTNSEDDDPTRLHLNKTQLDVLSSLSLLATTSLNDTTSPLKTTTELKSSSTSSSTTASVSTSNLTFPNHATSAAAATALRHKGNEQNMHNTNSLLTVDNVNATIVSANRTTTSKLQQQQYHHQHQHTKDTATKMSLQNTSSIAKGFSSVTSSSSGSVPATSSNSSMGDPVTANGNSSKINTGTTRISARKVDSKYILSKAHKTDAPMLNYIFDTFSSANKHHHHDQRYGPHFEDVQLVGQPTNMTVQAGSSIHLNCRISLLQDKTVSWVRRNSQGENALDLLTVGLHTYTGDKRYKMEFQYPSNWRLKINNVKKDDEATYECQISTHPPRVIQINLHVNAPKVMIVDEFGDPLQEKYYEQDSTLQLSCVVRNVAMSSSVVFWKHSEDVLNYDVTRGGVSVKTELMDDGANSTLFIAKINKADSGNYTCSISEYQNYTIVVHILNGESFAELHHGAAFGWQQLNHQTWLINLLLATILLLLLPAYIYR
ncbi:putative GPI-anchored protein pfl2 [Lucilia cuprina]|uniref:putative GPI-anchored protein pfl2 n=1 Tax=Lucilia cuprina TaxID=7375 RepID=UPI001F070DD8|nr:putative GPI-anchored protein pfl2 [Lucilia cuprina]XP_046809018.1 putative GPI-anchored protein pfl2 [Lucilia cuprina]XP_046809019.1 putative GPI-anchored protein pfl2 [Lucilia cuprina]